MAEFAPTPQLAPFSKPIGVLPAYYSRGTETLVLQERLFSMTGDTTISTLSGQPLFQVKGEFMSMSARKSVTDMRGQQLFVIRKELFSMFGNYYAEDPAGARFLSVEGKWSFGGQKCNISFISASDGQTVALKMNGNFWATTAEILCNGQTIALVQRRMPSFKNIFKGIATYHVTVAPNVDLALVTCLCVILDEKRDARGGSNSAITAGIS